MINCKFYDVDEGWCKLKMNWVDNMPHVSYNCEPDQCPHKIIEIETNLTHICSLSATDLAKLLIGVRTVEDLDYDWEENLYLSGTHEEYGTSDGECFYDYDEALSHEIEWLNAEYKENKND